MYLDEQYPDSNLYRLKVIISNEKVNLNFDIQALRMYNDPWLIGLLKTENPHKYQ